MGARVGRGHASRFDGFFPVDGSDSSAAVRAHRPAPAGFCELCGWRKSTQPIRVGPRFSFHSMVTLLSLCLVDESNPSGFARSLMNSLGIELARATSFAPILNLRPWLRLAFDFD